MNTINRDKCDQMKNDAQANPNNDGHSLKQDYFSLKEVAKMLGCSERHIKRAIESNELLAIDISSTNATRRRLRVYSESLTNWLAEKKYTLPFETNEWDELVLKHFPKS